MSDPQAVTVAQAIARARDRLRRAGVPADECDGDAEVLARHALRWDVAQLVASRNHPAPAGFEAAYTRLIERRTAREPVSQIVGHREFWGLDFLVTRDVLTPRPESEALVEAALALVPPAEPSVIVDVGTGSGCLAVALAIERPAARIIATDVSAEALAVAQSNAARHHVEERIRFVRTDLLPPLDEVDLIVSNPPYVSLQDAPSLAAEVREYEPHVALFAGGDGLDVYRRLLTGARGVIAPSGRLVVELGYDQAPRVRQLAQDAGWEVEATRRDLQGIERAMTLRPNIEDQVDDANERRE